MKEKAADLASLARAIDEAFPSLDAVERRIALAVHQLMIGGAPVSTASVARAAAVGRQRVEEALQGWPGVFRDEQGRVIGFWGLALEAVSPHELQVGGRTLYTWCAWDALFLPEILGKRAVVASRCPVTDRPISLHVTAAGIDDIAPRSAVVSMLGPEAWREGVECDSVLSTVCRRIHFFESGRAAEDWRSSGEQVLILTLDQAYELGRIANRLRYGVALETTN